MIKIYFAGSIRGGRDMARNYQELISFLKTVGQVFTEHVGDEEALKKDKESLTDREIHDRDMEWIRKSDLMVAEVSIPSLGVGYEIASAINLGKPVLCLYNENSKKQISAMISGSKELKLISYKSPGEIEAAVKSFIAELKLRGEV